jgi:hypothetical protein
MYRSRRPRALLSLLTILGTPWIFSHGDTNTVAMRQTSGATDSRTLPTAELTEQWPVSQHVSDMDAFSRVLDTERTAMLKAAVLRAYAHVLMELAMHERRPVTATTEADNNPVANELETSM